MLALLGLSGAVLAAIVGLNLLLEGRAAGGPAIARLASEWQQSARGVTYAPPYTDSRYFKRLRLADRLPDINAIVLGDSMLMALTEGLFRSASGRTTFRCGQCHGSVAAEFEYVERHLSDRVRFALIGLDWRSGCSTHPTRWPRPTCRPMPVPAPRSRPPLHERMADALSRPKVANLGAALPRAAP